MHSYVELKISVPAWNEIAELLRAADYGHVFKARGRMDMTNIALYCEPEKAPPSGDQINCLSDWHRTPARITDPAYPVCPTCRSDHKRASIT